MKKHSLGREFRLVSDQEKLNALVLTMGPCKDLLEAGYGRFSFSGFLEQGSEIKVHLYHTKKRVWELTCCFNWDYEDRLKWLNLWIPAFDPRSFGHQTSKHLMRAHEGWWPSEAWGLCWLWEIFWPLYENQSSECVITWWMSEEEYAQKSAVFFEKTWALECDTDKKNKKRL